MPKVSVIIPIFGVEKYIERCARSLFEQTLDDIEYLFVDDCSPDDSVNILMKVQRPVRPGDCPQSHLPRRRNDYGKTFESS